MVYTIRYVAGPYSGYRTVNANDEETAIAKVRAEIQKDMTIPMYSDSYKIVDTIMDKDTDDDD